MKKGYIFLVMLFVTTVPGYAQLVISQVYGGAGCGTAGCSTYRNDFIEIFNRGATSVNLNGWSVQYATATGTTWQATNLSNVILSPGKFYLIAGSFGGNGVNPLPTPDVAGTIVMSATAGKVALVNDIIALTGACPTGSQIVDFVGYGTTANCNEGGANAPAPSTTTADIRSGAGCTDAGNNSTDFTAATPTPRNNTVAASPCFPLPVNFGTVRAYRQGDAIKVEWTNLTEFDVIRYSVERSADGFSFSAIVHQDPRLNNGSKADYSFMDVSPVNGVNYYRICSAELSGRNKFSIVVKIDMHGGQTGITIYPNPVIGNQVSLQMPGLQKGQYTIRVINASGQQEFSKLIFLNGGAVTEVLQLPVRIKTGMYSLHLSNGKMSLTKPFIMR